MNKKDGVKVELLTLEIRNYNLKYTRFLIFGH